MPEVPFSTLFRDVSEALKKMIKTYISDVEVVFDSPGEIEKSKDKRVIVYWYELMENSYLRNQPPELTAEAMPTARPMMYMNLRYMIVPYASAETELILANQLTVIFRENPVLNGNQVNGTLKATGNTSIKIDPFYPAYDEINRIWGLFPNVNYKFTLYFEVWPVRIPLEAIPAPARVTRISTGYQLPDGTQGEN